MIHISTDYIRRYVLYKYGYIINVMQLYIAVITIAC